MADVEQSDRPRRPYRLAARAAGMQALRERVLAAADARFAAAGSEGVSLEDVARDAGTTVQTVLRHFGSKEGLLDEALRITVEHIRAQRSQAPIDDVRGAVRNLLEHYEEFGDRGIRMLAEEQRSLFNRTLVADGRALHRDWVAGTFPGLLVGLRGARRERRLAQLVAVCDIYVWKVLRRDVGLSPTQTETALVELIEALEARE
jgi:AcrR family transcriptional regulator